MQHNDPDPLAGFLTECKTANGELAEELVRCALASAYRAGYAKCLGKLPNNMDGCPVRPAQWPIDNDRVDEMEKKFRDEFGRH